MNRDMMVERAFDAQTTWDMVVVGGGATGVGMALDAASRGYSVCLIEQDDFGKGTSSRSTKLVHGGVRYLQQGNLSLVREALRERGLLRRNAPHLVTDREFIVPVYAWWEAIYYGIGLRMYDLLAGSYGLGGSRWLSAQDVRNRIPGLSGKGLRGGVAYYDGQFDDARLLVNMVQTAVAQGAVMLNYCRCARLQKGASGRVEGVTVLDLESGHEAEVRARVVVNATGCFADALRLLDNPEDSAMVAASQGIHLVLDGEFLAGNTAVMIPKTSDGRVLFAIPWHGRTVVGTTDTPIDEVSLEPRAQEEEIQFVLTTAAKYLAQTPQREDVRSVFTGIRPLVRQNGATHTAALSRDHTLVTSPSGLVTITGGKWTTYRHMAKDGVDHAARVANLPERACCTDWLNIRGHHPSAERFGDWWFYGADAPSVEGLCHREPALRERLHPDLPVTAAQVIWAVSEELARTVEDVLSRRTRALLLNAEAASEVAPKVARLMAAHLGKDDGWVEEQVAAFGKVADGYQLAPGSSPQLSSGPEQRFEA